MSADRYELLLDWFLDQFQYPYDVGTETLPPESVRKDIEDWWVKRDGDHTIETEFAIRDTCAEEGGWGAHSAPVQP